MRASWTAILHVGGPAIASGLIQPVSMLIITRLLAGHGHEVVAGYNVASRVETMAHMILWSVSSSAEPFIGQNWGARRYDRVKQALRLCNVFCLVWGVITFMVMVSAGSYLVSLIDAHPKVVEVAAKFFLIIPLTIGLMGVMQVSTACFNALGRPLPPLTISVTRTILLTVPLSILGDHLYGYVGIFLATGVTNVAIGVVAWRWSQAYLRTATAPALRAAAAG